MNENAMKKNRFWKIVSFLFNPLLAPLWCVALYYFLTPRMFVPLEAVYTAAVVAMATVIIPLSVLLLLKVTGKIESMSLHQAYERRLPLLLICILMACAVRFYLAGRVAPAMPLALGAAAISVLITYISLYWDKISLHAMGVSGAICFVFMMMVKWEAPLSYALGALIPMLIVYDLVVMARMELGRHNARQIVLGTLVGAFPQILVFAFLYGN